MVKILFFNLRHVEADKVISMRQPYTTGAYRIDIKTGSCIHRMNKTFILYTLHRHEIHEQSIFPKSFIFVFNSTIDSLYLID